MLFRSAKSAIADRQASSRSSVTTGCGPGSVRSASSQMDRASSPAYPGSPRERNAATAPGSSPDPARSASIRPASALPPCCQAMAASCATCMSRTASGIWSPRSSPGMPLPSQRSHRCRSASWICSERPIRAPSTLATSQWLAAHLRNSVMPPNADLAMAAARASRARSGWATRAAVPIRSRRVPNATAIICGRADSSSPKNRASISLSAVHPAKCSRPV